MKKTNGNGSKEHTGFLGQRKNVLFCVPNGWHFRWINCLLIWSFWIKEARFDKFKTKITEKNYALNAIDRRKGVLCGR